MTGLTQSFSKTTALYFRSRSFIQSGLWGGGGGGLEFPPARIPPPSSPEILKLSTVIIGVPSILACYMLLDISMYHQNVWKVCPKLHQKQSERSKFGIFLGGGGGGGGERAPRPP